MLTYTQSWGYFRGVVVLVTSVVSISCCVLITVMVGDNENAKSWNSVSKATRTHAGSSPQGLALVARVLCARASKEVLEGFRGRFNLRSLRDRLLFVQTTR